MITLIKTLRFWMVWVWDVDCPSPDYTQPDVSSHTINKNFAFFLDDCILPRELHGRTGLANQYPTFPMASIFSFFFSEEQTPRFQQLYLWAFLLQGWCSGPTHPVLNHTLRPHTPPPQRTPALELFSNAIIHTDFRKGRFRLMSHLLLEIPWEKLHTGKN